MTVPVNTHDQNYLYGGERVFIIYIPADYGRGGHGAYFQVFHTVNGKEVPTDPGGPWYYYGRKSFMPHGFNGANHHESKRLALQAAMDWAKEQYGERTWVRNRAGDYVEKEVNDKYPLPKKERKT